MSGGHFDYAYMRVINFADQLEDDLAKAKTPDSYGQLPYDWSPEVVTRLRETLADARWMATLMREAEWLYSGDHSEESYLRLTKDGEGRG